MKIIKIFGAYFLKCRIILELVKENEYQEDGFLESVVLIRIDTIVSFIKTADEDFVGKIAKESDLIQTKIECIHNVFVVNHELEDIIELLNSYETSL
jgi:hypothetical protein